MESTAAKSRAMSIKITSKKIAEQFLDLFEELEIYSFYTECNTSILWFRHYESDVVQPYTIMHEDEGVIGVTREFAINYIYRNRKYFNYWITSNNTECWLTAKAN